jgi:hypothetical protein
MGARLLLKDLVHVSRFRDATAACTEEEAFVATATCYKGGHIISILF